MKLSDFNKLPEFKDTKSLTQQIVEDCNNFLKTREGLRYLCMKYQNYSVMDAVRNYHSNAQIAIHSI